jgi:signal transduction histidine kinase
MSGYLFAAACVVFLCVSYGAGRAALSRWRTAAVAAVAGIVLAARLVVQLAAGTGGIRPAAVTGFVSACVVFVLLPLLAGRYVAQQRAARDVERVRIARDMHDSLGRALSLAAVQAAALEVSGLPAPQREAAARLGVAIRDGVTELHEIVGVLRGPARGMAAAIDLVDEFRDAGADVSVRSSGRPLPLSRQADEAAYRVIEEGLTNAMRHAPGQPVSVTVSWRAGSLALTVVNPVAPLVTGPAGSRAYIPGAGLDGLTGRLREAGGALTHDLSGGRPARFRLSARLPLTRRARLCSGLTRHRIGLGFAVGLVLLVIVPATVLLGAR